MKEIIELEQEANREILKDLKEVLNNNINKYMRTSAFMILNKCIDELIYLEQYAMLQEYKENAI